ncbi:magnesium transporter [candidate division KSB1 bacterium]
MPGKTDRTINTILQTYLQLYPDEVVNKLETLPVEEIARLIAAQPVGRIIPIFKRLSIDLASQIIKIIKKEIAVKILSELEPNRTASILAILDNDISKQIMDLLDRTTVNDLKELMTFPPDSAGSLMDPMFLTLRPDMTVSIALKRLRKFRKKNIHDVFLVDEEGRFVGAVPLQELVVSLSSERLEHLKRKILVFIQATSGREEIVEEFSKHRLSTLPVVDFDGRLVGVIRYDAIIGAAQEEAAADILTMVGAGKQERALSKASFAVRKRLPWLTINLGTAFLAAAVVGIFENIIAQFTALAILLPVVAGQSGNTGAQALAVTMRGLVLREIRIRQWLRVSVKEISVGFLNGISIALTTSLAVYIWSRSIGLSLIIGCSMVISMALAGLSGAAIPLILTKFGMDPAQSSSIILTTITDVVGFFSFLGIATLMAGII